MSEGFRVIVSILLLLYQKILGPICMIKSTVGLDYIFIRVISVLPHLFLQGCPGPLGKSERQLFYSGTSLFLFALSSLLSLLALQE